MKYNQDPQSTFYRHTTRRVDHLHKALVGLVIIQGGTLLLLIALWLSM